MNELDTIAKVPLSTGTDGVIRIGNTRITLDTIVQTFLDGSTAEEIVYQYPVLDLSDVYAVISYYLKNRHTVEQYLQTSQLISEQLRLTIEQRFQTGDVRQRLMVRKAELTNHHS